MAEKREPWISVARILRPQGRRGEVLADLLTDFPESLSAGREIFLSRDDDPAPPRAVSILSHWLPHGRNEGRVVLTIAGIDSISAAEALAGHDLVVREAARIPLPGGSRYISDLVGLQLCSGGTSLGRIEDVSFPLSADGRRRLEDAAPLLVVRSPSGDEILVPFVEALIVRVDPTEQVIEMNLPEGLIDLNTASET